MALVAFRVRGIFLDAFRVRGNFWDDSCVLSRFLLGFGSVCAIFFYVPAYARSQDM